MCKCLMELKEELLNIIEYIHLYIYVMKKKNVKKNIRPRKNNKSINRWKKELKQNLESNKIISYMDEENSIRNDLKKSKIINECNIKSLDFIKKRLKLYGRDKKLSFQLLYSVKIDGDKSQ